MEVIAGISGAVALVELLAIVGLWLRAKGLNDELRDANKEIGALEERLKDEAAKVEEGSSRHTDQVAALIAEIRKLESDLDHCDSPGVYRSRLERLFQQAEAINGDDDQSGVPE